MSEVIRTRDSGQITGYLEVTVVNRRHADIRATMNIYGDTASDMREARGKIVQLALQPV